MTDLERGEKSDPSLYPPRWGQPVEHQGDPQEKSPTSVDMGGRAAHVVRHENTTDEYSDGHGGAADGEISRWLHALGIWVMT